MSALRQAPRSGRRALLVVAGLAVIVGLIVVFSGSLTRSTDIEARAELARTEIAALEDIAAAGQAELAFFGTDAFVRWQARVYGFGDKSAGEKPRRQAEFLGSPSRASVKPDDASFFVKANEIRFHRVEQPDRTVREDLQVHNLSNGFG